MRKVICIICLMMIGSSGCTAYWYQPGKTLEQCSQDIIECKFEAKRSGLFPLQLGFFSTSPSPMEKYYIDCMRLKGYRSYQEKYLPVGVKTRRVPGTGISFYAAGE